MYRELKTSFTDKNDNQRTRFLLSLPLNLNELKYAIIMKHLNTDRRQNKLTAVSVLSSSNHQVAPNES